MNEQLKIEKMRKKGKTLAYFVTLVGRSEIRKVFKALT